MVTVHPSSPQHGGTIWLTGLPASGKTSLARALAPHLQPCLILDGDELRAGLNRDLGFSPADRAENVRRVAELARLIAAAGQVAIVALVSPYRADRALARERHQGLRFLEVWLSAPVEVCAARDPKGLYARARAGTLSGLTGIDAPYEPPERADLVVPAELDLAAATASLRQAWADTSRRSS